MKNFLKNKTFWLLVLSIIGIIVGLVFKNSTELGFCLVSEPTCLNQLTQIGNAIFYSMQAIALVFLVLLFVPHAFNAWKKFAIWFLPLMFIYFAIYENQGFFSVPEESVYRFLSVVYAALSLAIIGWKMLQKQRTIS